MTIAAPSFCKSWFRAKKRPTEHWSAELAKLAHDAGSPYTALIGDPKRPTHFVEVTSDSCGVGFLDEQLREYLTYAFQTTDDGKLFLSMATFRDFEEGGDFVVNGTNYVFSRAGGLDIRRVTFRPERSEEIATGQTDVSGNYERRPPFGCYDDLLKRERFSVVR